jgi:hypothetical protein
MAMVLAPAAILFTRSGVDDDDSYLKMLQRIAGNIWQPYNPFEALSFLTSVPVPMKVFAKKLGAYSELSKSLLLYAIGNEQDAMTQKGYLKGFKESARYAGGVVSAGYKL